MESIIRATAIFFFLWFITRVTGKRELAELTPFEMILLISMGDLIQQGVTQEDMSITGAAVAVSTFTFWILLLSWTSWRWQGARHVVEGRASIVVRDGETLDEVLALERVSMDELLEEARGQGIEDLRNVKLAVLEPDGKMSFLQHGENQHPPDEKHVSA